MHHILPRDIVLLAAARTPIGRFNGSLSDFGAIDLGALAIGAAVSRAGVDPARVDAANMGVVVSAGLGLAPAKAACVRAGLPDTIQARAVETVCASAMDAIALACDSLVLETSQVVVAGGMESRTNAPYLLGPKFCRSTDRCERGLRLRVKRRGAYRFLIDEDHEEQLRATDMIDPTTYDGLFWPEERKFMRQYALEFAERRGYTPELVNQFAAESHRKAREATEKGLFREEIVPAGQVADDDLLPADRLQRELAENPDDLASAYNASTPADNASAVVVTTAQRAAEMGCKPLARILGYARLDGPASDYVAAPVRVVSHLTDALRAAGRPTDFTIIEVNEAFGVQLPMFAEAFQGMEINVHGGAIALGHPLGAAGARILTTLVHAMRRYGHRLGLAAICYGGGGAYAMALEALA
jgi:acetyl-CoA C-acetyltransferase